MNHFTSKAQSLPFHLVPSWISSLMPKGMLTEGNNLRFGERNYIFFFLTVMFYRGKGGQIHILTQKTTNLFLLHFFCQHSSISLIKIMPVHMGVDGKNFQTTRRDWDQSSMLLKSLPSTYKVTWSFGEMGKVSGWWERLCHLTNYIHLYRKELKIKNNFMKKI